MSRRMHNYVRDQGGYVYSMDREICKTFGCPNRNKVESKTQSGSRKHVKEGMYQNKHMYVMRERRTELSFGTRHK